MIKLPSEKIIYMVANCLPFLLFVTGFLIGGIYLATTGIIFGEAIAIILINWAGMNISTKRYVFFLLTIVLGGLTIALKQPKYIIYKTSIVYTVVGSTLLYLRCFKKEELVDNFKKIIGAESNKIKDYNIYAITIRMSIFLYFMAIINYLIGCNFSQELWLQFKVFICPLILIAYIGIEFIFFDYRGRFRD